MYFLKTNVDFLFTNYSITHLPHAVLLIYATFSNYAGKNFVVMSNQIKYPSPTKIVNVKRLFSLFQLTVLVTTQELDRDLAMYYSLDFFCSQIH